MGKTGFRLGAVGRREFLMASGGLAAAAGAMSVAALAAEPPGVIAQWQAAPSLPLWPDGTPGGGFRRQPAGDTPPIFLRNV